MDMGERRSLLRPFGEKEGARDPKDRGKDEGNRAHEPAGAALPSPSHASATRGSLPLPGGARDQSASPRSSLGVSPAKPAASSIMNRLTGAMRFIAPVTAFRASFSSGVSEP